jgi:hypothetical protein
MAECLCMTPPFVFLDYEFELLGLDETNGRFGEVSLQTCKACGRQWLHYFFEYEVFLKSGRWFRGLVPAEQLVSLSPESAVELLESLPRYFYSGSYFETTGRQGSRHVDGYL